MPWWNGTDRSIERLEVDTDELPFFKCFTGEISRWGYLFKYLVNICFLNNIDDDDGDEVNEIQNIFSGKYLSANICQ